MTKPCSVGILASTNGTILPAIFASDLPDVVFPVLITDKENCGAREKARAFGIPDIHVPTAGRTREEWDQACIDVLRAYHVDIVVLAGFMRILSNEFVRAFSGRILNVHPSLLPKYSGGMNLNVHRAVLEAGETQTGATIHIVTEDVDGGPILLQQAIPVLPNDTPDSLKDRVQALEKKLYPQAILLLKQQINPDKP